MKNFTFLYTLTVSGLVYLTSYIVVTKNYHDGYAALSFGVGLCVYLMIRLVYKKNEDLDKLLAKAYRLFIVLVPLVLIFLNIILYFTTTQDEPKLQAFYSFEDLQWAGPFVFGLWPILNLFVLVGNIMGVIWLAVYFLGLPLFLLSIIVVIIMIVLLIKKIMQLQPEFFEEFSLLMAATHVLTPILCYTGIVYLWL